MAVPFAEIMFHNANAIDVSLTVEAPVGRIVVDAHNVPAKSTYRVSPGVSDCVSALLIAGDPSHGKVRQSFGTALPIAGEPSYIAHLAARHVVGSIHGTILARTDGEVSEKDEFLSDVEKDGAGRPSVLSRWGWKKMTFNRKVFLVAASRDEALDALRADGEREPESLIDGCASRDPNNTDCYNTGKCTKAYCRSRSIDTGIRICVCTDDPG